MRRPEFRSNLKNRRTDETELVPVARFSSTGPVCGQRQAEGGAETRKVSAGKTRFTRYAKGNEKKLPVHGQFERLTLSALEQRPEKHALFLENTAKSAGVTPRPPNGRVQRM